MNLCTSIYILCTISLAPAYASATLNMLISLMKSFIYKQRVNNSIVGINGFISYLKYYQTIEKNIYLKNNMIQRFDIKWNNCKLV